MRKAILVISGFTQQMDQETGSTKLWKKLMPVFTKNDNHNDMTVVFLKEWKYDWEDFAGFLNRHGFSECLVCAYSWGAGWGLREFSKHYTGQISAVLCDPVYRSKFPWMRWRAVIKMWQPTIKYPRNVSVKAWFYQTEDEPGNDNVFTEAPLPKKINLGVKHNEIDDHHEYHETAMREAEVFTKSKKK